MRAILRQARIDVAFVVAFVLRRRVACDTDAVEHEHPYRATIDTADSKRETRYEEMSISYFRRHPCLSCACFGCTDQAAGSSSLSASAAAAVACTLPGL